MHLYVLGGNSARNKPWAHSLQGVLDSLVDGSEVHDYAHWESGEPSIDIDKELAALSKKINASDEYMFVAKSMGTVLAAKGIAAGILSPKLCVFMGIPLRAIAQDSIPFGQWLQHCPAKIVILQNSHDPLGSAAEIQDYLVQHNITDRQVTELDGKTHDYPDLNRLKQEVAHSIHQIL